MFEGIYIFLWDNKILFILYLKLRYNIPIKIQNILYLLCQSFSNFQSILLWKHHQNNTYYFQSINVKLLMALNKFMHPRNPYKVPPNFKEMAVKYPEFRKVVTQDLAGKIHLDFNNPVSLRLLTETLFLKDFDLTISIPPKCLVPTLPSRMNYLLWVEDLLSILTPESTTHGVL